MKGSFNLVSSSFAKIGTSEHFDTGQNSSFPYVLTTTLKNIDLESSQSAQKVQINFVENGLPEGAEYRIYRTTANGGNYTSDPIAFVNGTNTIQVGSVGFNRTVKIQFSASASTAEFDQLSVNGVSLYGESFPSLDVPEGSELASAYFESGNNATHPLLYESANSSDGLSSQAQQTFSLNVTALPENGATYIVYKTYNNGQGDTTSPTPLVIGQNLVTVNSVSFDQATGRTVRLLLSEDVAIDEFSVNGTYVVGSNSNSFTAPEGSELASAYFDTISGVGQYAYSYTLANIADGISSQAEQVLSLNITAIPDEGASYSIYKTTDNGNEYTSNPVSLTIGQNQIVVSSVNFNEASGRNVKVRITENIAIDEFVVNGTYIVGDAPSPPPEGSIYANEVFSAGTNVSWPWVYTATTASEGINSQASQTFIVNITQLPEGGANYRIYKTTENNQDYFSPEVSLNIGLNIFTVPATDFNRAVKLQFSSGNIAMEYFGINGLDIIGTPIDSDGDGVYDYNDFAPSDSNVQVPQLNISRDGQSVIISWIAHPGLSVKYSSDLTSFTPVTSNIRIIRQSKHLY